MRFTIGVLFAFLFWFVSVSASGLGACVKRPDPSAPEKGDLYTMRIAHGENIAESHGEHPSRPGSYYYHALRECRPQQFTAVYDSQGNAHLEFVIKDRKVAGLPLKGPNRNVCDVKAIIGHATDGSFEPTCPFGGPDVLAAQWTKSQQDQSPAPKAPYEQQ